MKIDVLGSHDIRNVWIENSDEKAGSFLGFIQLFSDMMAITVKSAALETYIVYIIILKVSATKTVMVDR